MPRRNFQHQIFLAAILLAANTGARAQSGIVATSPPPPTPPSNNIVAAKPAPLDAPQVITVVHRLDAGKVLRALRLSGVRVAPAHEEIVAASGLLTHISAGFALDDGLTVIARLPQRESELDATATLFFGAPNVLGGKRSVTADVLVVRRNGESTRASFVGLDGGTGLSLLRVEGLPLLLTPAARDADETELAVGQSVHLYAPVNAENNAADNQSSGVVALRVSQLQGTVTEISRESSGKVSRLKICAPDLSKALVGGVVVNDGGETVGMVESFSANEARVMPARLVRRAATRVLARRASVPGPWLGVRGETVAASPVALLIAQGWRSAEAAALIGKRRGILLTSVAPNTPAALASLRPGSVIVRVNGGEEIQSAEDFSAVLSDAGAGATVSFTVLQPGNPNPFTTSARLSETFNPSFSMEIAELRAAQEAQSLHPLIERGVETVALSPAVAKRYGARSGLLLVVGIHAQSPATSAGLRPGDVIESVNGKNVTQANSDFASRLNTAATLSLGILRDGQKLTIILPARATKQR